MSAFYDINKTPRKILNQAIVKAIVAESNGAWFDPSDMSTLYQDAAGTTPVTAVEQPVGKMLDKSGNGNHATQSVTASRPTLSARKNILLATETLATQSVTTLAATYTLSFTGTGSVTLSGTATGTLAGNGIDRVSLTFTPTAGTLTLTVSGSVTKAQIELGAVAGPYQRVNTSTDYDTDERYFPKYLRFDGIDDYMNLPYMGLYAGGACSVVVARDARLSTTAKYLVCERNSTTTNPYYVIDGYDENTLNGGIDSRSDSLSGVANSYSVDSVSEGSIVVVSHVDSGSVLYKYFDGELVKSTAYSRTGVSMTLNTTSIGGYVTVWPGGFVNNKLYSLIITKSALTDAQRVRCERFLARKAGVML